MGVVTFKVPVFFIVISPSFFVDAFLLLVFISSSRASRRWKLPSQNWR